MTQLESRSGTIPLFGLSESLVKGSFMFISLI
jgi:hypothetical protein